MPPEFYNPSRPLQIHEKHLPHWRQDGVVYFITSRLADSMPQEKLHQWQTGRRAWLRTHGSESPEQIRSLSDEEQHEFHRLFTALWHQWLDAGLGECVLRKPDTRKVLIDALAENHDRTYSLDAWVVMPNHIHALIALEQGSSLGAILKQLKGGSARAINRMLGREGSLWQAEPYDHIVRSAAQFQHYRRYIAQNPVLARLRADDYSVGLGSVVWPSAEALYDSLQPPDRELSTPRSTETEG